MKAEISDSNVLSTLRPLDIISYLHATGWRNVEDLGDRASVWLSGRTEDIEVIVPKRQNFGDFSLRVSEILKTLSHVENRSQLQVFSDVSSVSSDVVRLRAATRDSEQGTLPIDNGVAFVGGAYDAILAAACSTVVRKGNFPSRKPVRANEYLKRVRLGQTERGSFILTLHCPGTPRLRPAQTNDFSLDEPFERRVTKTLMSGLVAVRNAAQHAASTSDFAPFRQSVSAGVSANLCSAILKLGAVVPDARVEVDMVWARSRGPETDVPNSVFIEPDYYPVIEEAVRLFTEIEPQEDFHLIGFIQQLDRRESDSIGTVSVISVVDEKARRVTINLPESQYAIATDAHTRRKTISCVGELVKEGRSYKLLYPRDLQMLEDEDVLFSS